MNFKDDLTYGYASQCFEYDPDAGVLIRKIRPRDHFKTNRGWKISNSKWAGKEAGTKDIENYRYVKIDGSLYAVHRLAFLLMTGKFPENEIDHINGNCFDNRWNNLRVSNRIQQSQNTKVKSTSVSGIKGVFFNKRTNRWFSNIRVNGKRIHIGTFDTMEECAAARREAEEKYHGQYAREA